MTERHPAIRAIALFEAGKGALVLLVGCGAFALAGGSLNGTAAELVARLHLNPVHHVPFIFADLVKSIGDTRLWLLALGGLVYATVRIAEGWGLWWDRAWAEVLAAVSSAIYLPIEAFELGLGVTPIKLVALALNLLVLAVMVHRLVRRRRQRGRAD